MCRILIKHVMGVRSSSPTGRLRSGGEAFPVP